MSDPVKDIYGNDHQVLTSEELRKLAGEDETAKKLLSWYSPAPRRDNRASMHWFTAQNSSQPRAVPTLEEQGSSSPPVFFYNPAVIEALANSAYTDFYKWEFAMAWQPPLADLTLDDFFDFCRARYDRKDLLNSWGSQRAGLQIKLGYTRKDLYYTRYYSGHLWPTRKLAERSDVKDEISSYDNRLNNSLERFLNYVVETWDSKRPYLRETLLLNEFLGAPGEGFTGTFQEFMDSYQDETFEERAARWEFKNYGNLDELIEFMNKRTVVDFNPTRQVRSRKLVFAQDRKTWQEFFKTAHEHNKGNNYPHLQQYLSVVEEKLSSNKSSYTILSPEVLRREYTILVAESVLQEGRTYHPEKLHGLATVALQCIPSEYILKQYAREYSEIYQILRRKLEEQKLEDEDATGVPKLMQTIGLLLATFFPNSWLRSGAQNGPYLLRDMLEVKGLEVIQLLGEMILEHKGIAPTENEWRKALVEEDVDWDMPVDFFLAMICSTKALQSGKVKGYADIVKEARAYFGHR